MLSTLGQTHTGVAGGWHSVYELPPGGRAVRMLFKKPTLALDEVRRALTHHGFTRTGADGSLESWWGIVDGEGCLVSFDTDDAPYDHRHRALDAIIRLSRIPRRTFFWAAGKPLPYSAE